MDNGDNLIEQVIVQMRERLVSRDTECEDFLKSIRESREDLDIKL